MPFFVQLHDDGVGGLSFLNRTALDNGRHFGFMGYIPKFITEAQIFAKINQRMVKIKEIGGIFLFFTKRIFEFSYSNAVFGIQRGRSKTAIIIDPFLNGLAIERVAEMMKLSVPTE
jgi:hypothetical protein